MQIKSRIKCTFIIINSIFFFCLHFAFTTFTAAASSPKTAEIEPSEATAIESLGLLIDLGQHKDAQKLYDSLPQEKKSNPEAILLSSRTLIATGQLALAKKKLVEYILLKPDDYRPYILLGQINGKEGRLKEAVVMFDKAISINPRAVKAYSDRGVAKGALGQVGESIKDFDRAISLDPRYADAYRNRGIAKEGLKNLTGACADWRAAAALGQDDPARWAKNQCK